jgi:hypothetical protein
MASDTELLIALLNKRLAAYEAEMRAAGMTDEDIERLSSQELADGLAKSFRDWGDRVAAGITASRSAVH